MVIWNVNGPNYGGRRETTSRVILRVPSRWLSMSAEISLCLCVGGFQSCRQLNLGCFSNKDSQAKRVGRHGAASSVGGGIASQDIRNTGSTLPVFAAIVTARSVGQSPSAICSLIILACARWWNPC